MDAKPLRIRFNKADGIIKIHDGIRFLELSNSYNDVYEVYYRIDSRIHNAIFDRIKYLVTEKSDDKDSANHNPARIRTDSYNSLPIEKILTLHNIIILITAVFNRDKNNYNYNTFLEKCLYKESNAQHF